ncbi:MAG: NfeD family protein [Bdellovibrionales bacterium]|nr:NfeD family protein [Bdellovibrionales bacterium]
MFQNSEFKILNIKEDKRSGQVKVNGDIWSFTTEEDIELGDQLQFVKRNGLKLVLKKK